MITIIGFDIFDTTCFNFFFCRILQRFYGTQQFCVLTKFPGVL